MEQKNQKKSLKNPPIDARLAAAAALVRKGKRIADIGTDHAYLPVYLVQAGIAVGGIATDVHPGPIRRAQQNIAQFGLEHKLAVCQCDGLCAMDAFSPQDILICGMGGELIARILADSAYVKKPDIHLILQPMTGQEELRKWLWDNGFHLEKEVLAKTDRVYEIWSVYYTAVPQSYTAAQTILGKYFALHPHTEPLLGLYLDRVERYHTKRRNGRKKAGQKTDVEDSVLQSIVQLRQANDLE